LKRASTSEPEFHVENHYVPEVYLKRFSQQGGKVYAYRTLVSHPNVRLWKPVSPGGIAYYRHLYTRIVGGRETDDIEKWLSREFEAPAENAIKKATTGLRLTREDWICLARFLAAQDVRTPAHFVRSRTRWEEMASGLLKDELPKVVNDYSLAVKSGAKLPQSVAPNSDYLPLRVSTEFEPGEEIARLRAEITIGRSYWIYEMRHLLTGVVDILNQHRWTVLMAPKGHKWFTSDAPVVKLNYQANGDYDFGGGWGSKGTEIFMPLSPYHLLYTQIGHRDIPVRGATLPISQFEGFCRIIASHAHRMIISSHVDSEVEKLRPRLVSQELYQNERAQWDRWHQEQSKAEH
jgi:hypothetical protein